MTLLAVAMVGVLVGYLARTSRIVAAPAVAALVLAVAIAALGGQLADSPIAFVTLVATAGVAFGVAARRFRLWETP